MSESGNHNNASEFDIFLRTADRLQFENCATAVLQEGKSIVIASNAKVMLDYYGAALIHRLEKEFSEKPVDFFMPTDASAMLYQFNKLLGTLKLDVATQYRDALLPEKIWVIHDAHALTKHELNLFTRLILKFPGAGIGAVLMFSNVNEQVHQLVDKNQQFLSWVLDRPTTDQTKAALEQSKINGNEEAVLDFLKHIAEASSHEIPRSPETMTSDDPLAEVSTPAMPSKEFKSNKFNNIWGIALVVLLAILLGLTVWLYPALSRKIGFFNGIVVPEPAEQKVPILVPEVVKTKPIEKNNAEGRVLAATPAETKDISAEQPQSEKIMEPLPPIAVQGQMWLKGLPDNIFILEHGVYETVKQAQLTMRDKAWLANARIIPSYVDGPDRPKFVVITGPFRSKDRAKNTIIRMGLSSDVVIKTQLSLLNMSNPSP